MPNELNLKTATFSRTNQYGVIETQTLNVTDLGASYKRMNSMINFEGFANPDAEPIKHTLSIDLDLTDPSHQLAIAVLSALIWEIAQVTPFIDDYELVDGKWISVKKSLIELNAVIEDFELG